MTQFEIIEPSSRSQYNNKMHSISTYLSYNCYFRRTQSILIFFSANQDFYQSNHLAQQIALANLTISKKWNHLVAQKFSQIQKNSVISSIVISSKPQPALIIENNHGILQFKKLFKFSNLLSDSLYFTQSDNFWLI